MPDSFDLFDIEEPLPVKAPQSDSSAPLGLDELLAKAGRDEPYCVIWAVWRKNLYPVLVSPLDFDKCERRKWFINRHPTDGSFYVRTNLWLHERKPGVPEKMSMHRFLMGMHGGLRCIHVNHVNHCTLDNRRRNLERVLPIVNTNERGVSRSNKTGYLGVYETFGNKGRPRAKPFRSEVSIGTDYYKFAGYFKTKEEAARERDRALRRVAQDHVSLKELNRVLNFPVTRKNRLKGMGKPLKRLYGAAQAKRTARMLYQEKANRASLDDIPF